MLFALKFQAHFNKKNLKNKKFAPTFPILLANITTLPHYFFLFPRFQGRINKSERRL